MTFKFTNSMASRLSVIFSCFLLISLFSLSGCNTPTKAVESAAQSEAQASNEAAKQETDAAQEEQAKIIKRSSTVSQKGTTIRAVVNGEPITNYDLKRRAAFLKLRRAKGNRSSKALEEMVDQKIKLQEAKKRRVVASDKEVNAAYANFAKSNRMNSSQMSSVLNKMGVTPGHFKEFIRSQISWNRAVGAKFRSDTTHKSTSQTMFEIRKNGEEKPTSIEYLLEQIIFVIPSTEKSKAVLSQRRKEALAFRERFTACGETINQAVGLRDVSVRKLPRTLELELPPEWKDELSALPQGSTTKIKNTEKGVEFLAICSKKTVSDDTVARVAAQQKEFETFNKKGSELSEKYFKELKAKSKIIYR